MRSGACMLDTYMRIASTHILLDRILSQMTWAALWSDAAFTARHRSPRDLARQHPCWLTARHLPGTRPPDFVAFQCSYTVLLATAPSSSSRVSFSLVHPRRTRRRPLYSTQREPPKDSGPHSFGGPHPLPALLATFFDGLTYPEGTPPCLSTGSRGSY